MRRFLMDKLAAWKENPRRKPLILKGARQVGKTWLLKAFGEAFFDNTVYVSFYHNARMRRIFEEDYDVDRILEHLSIELHTEIVPGKTLLIFDEVQDAPRVVESLKYFCEDKPELAVAAAGSLLGVSIHEGGAFPVGKVDELQLYPMDFAEFLCAMDEERLAELLRDASDPRVSEYRELYAEWLKKYYYIGGMPEAVERYREHRDLAEVREIQMMILNQYEGDFGKHIKATELPRLRMVWEMIPMQLAKENRKFFFGQVKEGGRAKEFEIAIQWLVDAGLVYRVHRVTKPAVPLAAYQEMTAFKLFFLDVGLLGAASGLDETSVIDGSAVFTEFKGALTEQYVYQELKATTAYRIFYYSGAKSTYETDFMIQKGREIVPIEVKAAENLHSKSLRVYCEKYRPTYAVRVSMSPYREESWMTNVPLWAVRAI